MNILKAKNEIDKLQDTLELYLQKKKINFIKSQPGSPIMKDIITGKNDGKAIFDKFAHYIIKDEELDSEIYSLQESINAYENYIIKEMKRISKYGGSELVRYYRDVEKKKWDEISKLTHYSSRQCHRLYEKDL
ncbi:unknown [Clostridium sp. CAG:1000]|jgi:hypothetical protein|nr:unknown [Clostridium sp. CAG:1000]DAI14538.1 MAG TPA: Protein of unknown function (DUF722) [Caudoviricetes sp.]